MSSNFFDFNKFFDWTRLLEPTPSSEWKFIWWAFGLSAGLLFLALVRAFWPGDLDLKHKTENLLVTLGILGLLLTFFRWQQIPYFSARIVWLALAIGGLIWLLLIIYYRQVRLPKKILQLKVAERKKKYLQ